MKEGLRKAVEAVFPLARVMVDLFRVIADASERMDEARRDRARCKSKFDKEPTKA